MISNALKNRAAAIWAAALSLALAFTGITGAPAHAANYLAPTLDTISALGGPDVGGNSITLVGSDWDPAGVTVSFGGSTGTVSNLVTDPITWTSSLSVVVPQNLAGGTVSVTVRNTSNTFVTNALSYTYYKSYPNYDQSQTAGGSGAVDLTLSSSNCGSGTTPCNFTPGVSVTATVGGAPLSGFTKTINGANSITVHMPAFSFTNSGPNANNLTPQVATIVVQNSNGYSASSTYTYYNEPSLTLPATFTAPVNQPMSTITLGHPGGPCTTAFTTSGTLPAGLVWNPTSETISGTATATTVASNFSVTCTNLAGTSTATITIGAAKQTQAISSFTLSGAAGGSGSYSITYGATAPVVHITSLTGAPYVVSSSDPNVVIGAGNVITISGATTGATLTAHLLETATHGQSADVAITLVVNKATQSISSFTLTGATGTAPSYSAIYGNSGISYATAVTPAVGSGSVTVSSADPCVSINQATKHVTITCVPNAGAGGSVTITADLAANANFDAGTSQNLTLNITKGQLGINFTPALVMVVGGVNQNLALNTSLTPAGIGAPYSVVYTLDPASAGICSLAGSTVTAISSGTCVVKAFAAGDANMTDAPLEIRNIAVKIYSQQILTFSGLSGSYQYGVTDINFAVSDLFGNPLIISAPNSNVATITQNGNSCILHIKGAGSVIITASDTLTQTYKSFTINVTPLGISAANLTATVQSNGHVQFDPAPLLGVINGDSVQLDISQIVATYNANGQVTWTGKFGLTGFNAPSYFLTAQPSAVVVNPSVWAANPGVASLIGGNKVTITGAGFTSGTQVSFGSMAAASVQVLNSTTIVAVTPAHNAGLAAVLVTVPGHGPLAAPSNIEFKELAPTIGSVTPAASNITGGNLVHIIGENFKSDAVVTVDGKQVALQSVTPNEITFVSPAHGAGQVQLTVTNPGLETTVWDKTFSYSPPVTVDAHAPVVSWTKGGGLVTLTGTNFATGIKVTVSGVQATNVHVVDTKTLTFNIPAVSAAGPADLVVTGNDGVAVTLPGVIQFVTTPSYKLVFTGKITALSAKTKSAIAKFVKQLAKSPIKINSLVISAYTANDKPSLTAITIAVARAKAIKKALTAAGNKAKLVVSAGAASGGNSSLVLVTVN